MKQLGEILHSQSQWVKGRAFLFKQQGSMCLGYALCLYRGLSWGLIGNDTTWGWDDARMNRIVHQLFPNLGNLVEFNNHPETTWEEIQKVIRLYDQEVEDGVPVEGYI